MKSFTSVTSSAPGHALGRLLLAAAAVVIFDQALKTLVRQTMSSCTAPGGAGCDYLDVGGVVGVLHVQNDGSAMGFVQGSGAWVALAVLGLLVVPLYGRMVKDARLSRFAIGLMAGGGLANLFDRLVFGSVTDFIAIGEMIVINPADMAVLLGVLLSYCSVGEEVAEWPGPGARRL
jgi:signal peptidase II